MTRIYSSAWLLLSTTSSSFAPRLVSAFTPAAVNFGGLSTNPFVATTRSFHSSTSLSMAKAGVATPEELRAFVQAAGDKLVVVDTRNPDAEAEPGDQKSLAVAALPSATNRPQAVHLMWDRESKTLTGGMDEFTKTYAAKDTPIITHCGGGGRGQLAKEYLQAQGYTQVQNGGGPKETACWAEFGDK